MLNRCRIEQLSDMAPQNTLLKTIITINNNYKYKIDLKMLKKTIEPCPKHNRKSNGLNGYDGYCIGFNGNYNGVYWYVMDSIGGMLNPIGKMPKTHYKNEFCNGFT